MLGSLLPKKSNTICTLRSNTVNSTIMVSEAFRYPCTSVAIAIRAVKS